MEIACIVGFVAMAIVAFILNIMIRDLNKKVNTLRTAVEAMLVTITDSCDSLVRLISDDINKNNTEK